jgi:flagellar biosynthesis chaperone FliJ
MNKQRRKAIADLIEKFQDWQNNTQEELSKFQSQLEELKSEIETIRDEEQEYKDNMPESLQNGDKGEQADTAITCLEEAISNAEDQCSEFDNTLNGAGDIISCLEQIE